MTTPSDKELDQVFERAMKFAEEAGTIALADRDMDKLKELYIEFATDIQALLHQERTNLISQIKGELPEERTELIGVDSKASYHNDGFNQCKQEVLEILERIEHG